MDNFAGDPVRSGAKHGGGRAFRHIDAEARAQQLLRAVEREKWLQRRKLRLAKSGHVVDIGPKKPFDR